MCLYVWEGRGVCVCVRWGCGGGEVWGVVQSENGGDQ